MYEFIDTTETQGAGTLSAESISFNGKLLENEIPGFRTLTVSGRELTGNEIEESKQGRASGTRLNYVRKAGRTITVTYQLRAENNREFREKFDLLNYLLVGENVRVIFADEPDKYFNGTLGEVDSVPPGANSIVSSFNIYCNDPFKYSLTAKKVVASGNSFSFTGAGSGLSHPVLNATMKSDNGYLAFINQDGALIQVGKPDEWDGATKQVSEQLLKSEVPLKASGWTLNNARVIAIDGTVTQTGTAVFDANVKGNICKPSSYGTGGSWHGPSVTKEIPADLSGYKGAKNFTAVIREVFLSSAYAQTAMQQIIFTSKTNTNICALTFYKNSTATNTSYIVVHINGKQVAEFFFEPNVYNDPYTNWSNGNQTIKKMNDAITITTGNWTRTFRDKALANVECKSISMYFAAFGNTVPIKENYIRSVTFTKHNVNKWEDVPNTFSSGDVVSVDTNTGSILLNGVEDLSLGALGNDWERFTIKKGLNTISCRCSSFAKPPEFELSYKEVWQ